MYSNVPTRNEDEWDEEESLSPEVDEYDELLMEAETDSKLIH